MRLRAFGEAIRLSRRKLHLTQADLAELSGLHANYISRVEHGAANISFENIDRIARALKLRASWLFDRANL